MGLVARVRGLVGIALSQLRHERLRSVLAVLGVAMAVLASVMLVSVGVGVLETGQQKFDQSGRDLWVTGGPVELQPGSVGGFRNSLIDAHTIERRLEARDDIAYANPLIFQTLYVSTNQSEFETIIGVGAASKGPSINFAEGGGIEGGDTHYANGTYDGPMQYEVIIDQRTARQYNLSVGDSVYLGGTLASASENEFTVVGISSTYSQFVGAPTVVMPPSEIQEITGTTASDRATMMSVVVSDGSDVQATADRLQRDYPDYTIRTNREQLQATLQGKAVVLASGTGLVVMAVVAGILLLLNLQLSFVYRHRETFGALRAIGTTSRSLAVVVLVNTLAIGIVGGIVGIGLAVPSIWVTNEIASAVSGFDGVVSVSWRLLLSGFVVSFAVSLLGGVAATLYLGRVEPLRYLR
ncbi:ABC transporter permease [Haloarcula onubensis]|uniref:ABC transporter permease n=1 Tax=Haloarcula onubensis TaxID=2950539 RepID=A0ABU2FJ64_9EURY|nr:ABC transporter permease [Halomicroarcula sp. S3CR25-11]MDS0280793.1 ABC transporter permease [Halomicroarcula sp. S3CR25-11]